MLFLYNGNPLFPYFGNCMDFCIKRNISETLNFEMFVFSHIFSPKIFEKLWNVCFFPILLPYYGNPLFSCVGNCMDICFQQKIPETLNFEMFMFSHIFSLLCEFTFLIFWKIYGLMPNMKYVRNPQLSIFCVFPYISLTMRIQLFPMFSELYEFLFHTKQSSEEYMRNQKLPSRQIFVPRTSPSNVPRTPLKILFDRPGDVPI